MSISHLYMIILIFEHFQYHLVLKIHSGEFSFINLSRLRQVCFRYFLFHFALPSMSCVSLELQLVTTITVLSPVSCNHMTSPNYGGKKARDGGLTCRCHLSNSIPDLL